jgi:hypothetical protein
MKEKGDAAVPSLRLHLKQHFDETKDRLELTLMQYLAD